MFIFVETNNRLTWSYHKIYQLICITETNIFQFCMKPRIFYENHLALTQFPSRQHLHVARVNAYKASCLIYVKCEVCNNNNSKLFCLRVFEYERRSSGVCKKEKTMTSTGVRYFPCTYMQSKQILYMEKRKEKLEMWQGVINYQIFCYIPAALYVNYNGPRLV